MLKKIAVRPVPHRHAPARLEGAWTDHPFWRARFVLDPADLGSCTRPVRECWIDTRLGPGRGRCARPDRRSGRAPRRTGGAERPAEPRATEPGRGDTDRGRRGAACRRHLQARPRRPWSRCSARRAWARRSTRRAACRWSRRSRASVSRNPGALVSLARLKTQDDYSYMHSVAVCALMVALGRKLGHGRGSLPRRRPGRPAARPGQGGDAAGGAEQARQADRRTSSTSCAATPSAATTCCWRPGRQREVLDVCLHHHETHRRHRLPARPGRRQPSAAGAHGRRLRRLRRHHLQPPLQGGLGPGRVDRPHGRLEGALRRRRVPGLRAEPGHLSRPVRWCGWNRAGWRWSIEQNPGADGADGQGLLLDAQRTADRAACGWTSRGRAQRPHRRPGAGGAGNSRT